MYQREIKKGKINLPPQKGVEVSRKRRKRETTHPFSKYLLFTTQTFIYHTLGMIQNSEERVVSKIDICFPSGTNIQENPTGENRRVNMLESNTPVITE